MEHPPPIPCLLGTDEPEVITEKIFDYTMDQPRLGAQSSRQGRRANGRSICSAKRNTSSSSALAHLEWSPVTRSRSSRCSAFPAARKLDSHQQLMVALDDGSRGILPSSFPIREQPARSSRSPRIARENGAKIIGMDRLGFASDHLLRRVDHRLRRWKNTNTYTPNDLAHRSPRRHRQSSPPPSVCAGRRKSRHASAG